MKPIGPLMVEHRLIERMVSMMSQELDRIKMRGKQTQISFRLL